MSSRNSRTVDPTFMSREEFIHIRKMTGCNVSQFARRFPITETRIRAYERQEKPRKVSAEDAEYMRRIEATYGGTR